MGLERRAARTYKCSRCGSPIPKGTIYFRDEPHPLARHHRGIEVQYFCKKCISFRAPEEPPTQPKQKPDKRSDFGRTTNSATPTDREEKSRFPENFNPDIDRYDWRSAARLFHYLWPEIGISLDCTRALAESIRVAHEASNACWEVSMFPFHLQLNVGQVEALTLKADEVRLLFRAPLSKRDASPGELEINSDPYYPAVPVPSGVCTVTPNELSSLPSAVRKAHNAYVRAAASFKRRSPFKKAFSPAVLEYLEVALGKPLPRPSYLSQLGEMTRVDPLPDELDVSTPMREGAKYQITVNATGTTIRCSR